MSGVILSAIYRKFRRAALSGIKAWRAI